MSTQTKLINKHQMHIYENEDRRAADDLIEIYAPILHQYSNRETIKILDIGGGSGYFAKKLCEYFGKIKCDIYVIDTTEYDSWEKNEYPNIHFTKASADNLSQSFPNNYFDIVFANRSFHHFVLDTWSNTVIGIQNILKQIPSLLKEEGRFCLTEHFFDGLFIDSASSRIIYTITSCRYEPIIKLCNKFRVESAGVGVCFLSKKMWLNLLEKAGFSIEKIEESNWSRVNSNFLKLLFLNKKNQLDNIIIAKSENKK